MNATKPYHIATVEETCVVTLQPKQSLVQQREIGTDVPDLVSGIDVAMRQDVDVIFIGEVSTVEAVDAALAAAARGVLVMINLHAPTAHEAIERLIDIHAPEAQAAFRKLLAGTLRCSLAQRLLKQRREGHGRLPAFDLLIPDDNLRAVIKTGGSISDAPRGPGSIMIKDHIRELVEQDKITQEAVDELILA